MEDEDIDKMPEEELRKLLKTMSKQTPPVQKIVVQNEKKIKKKFDGTSTVKYADWKLLAEAAIENKKDEDAKISLLLGALEGKALREIQRHPKADRSTAAKILELLQSKYGDRRTATQIRKQFYDLAQNEQTVVEFCDSLTECLEDTEDRLKIKSTGLDQMTRDQFAENVADDMLRWELKKYRDDNPDCAFDDLREIALNWESGMNKNKKKSTASYESSTQEVVEDPQLKSLTELVSNQQTQINTLINQQAELLKNLKDYKGSGPSGSGTGFLRCFYCQRPGHKKQFCRQRLRDEKEREEATKNA